MRLDSVHRPSLALADPGPASSSAALQAASRSRPRGDMDSSLAIRPRGAGREFAPDARARGRGELRRNPRGPGGTISLARGDAHSRGKISLARGDRARTGGVARVERPGLARSRGPGDHGAGPRPGPAQAPPAALHQGARAPRP